MIYLMKNSYSNVNYSENWTKDKRKTSSSQHPTKPSHKAVPKKVVKLNLVINEDNH